MENVAYKIVLVRHGESQWNLENKFCGWHDADLSPKGLIEAKEAGKVIFNKLILYSIKNYSVNRKKSFTTRNRIEIMSHLLFKEK